MNPEHRGSDPEGAEFTAPEETPTSEHRETERAPTDATTETLEARREIEGLVTPEDIEAFLQTPEFQAETDARRRHDLLAYWLMEQRMATGFAIPDIETAHGSWNDASAHEYAVWDYGRAEEILKAQATEPTPTAPPTPTPTAPPPTTPSPPTRARLRAGVVDIESKIEEVARHRAEERLHRELRGEFGERGEHSPWWQRAGNRLLSLGRRTMRHWGEEGYRQRYITEERQRLQVELDRANPNLFAPEERTSAAFRAESQAIIDRFLLEYDEVIRTSKGEHRELLAEGDTKRALHELVAAYANGDLDDRAFTEQKTAILDTLRATHPDVFTQERSTIDNLLDIAQEFRAVRNHGERIAAMDFDLDVQLGQARSGIQDESHLRAFDRLVSRVQRTPVLNKLVSPATLGFATSLLTKPAFSALRMGAKAAGFSALGVGTVVGGAYAGARRSTELKRDIAHVRRGTAMGYGPEAGARRVERMQEFVYDQARVADVTAAIQGHLEALRQETLSPEERANHMAGLAEQIGDAEARMDAGTALQHDFLQYEDPTRIERGRLDLLRSIAEAKVAAQRLASASADPAGEQGRFSTSLTQSRADREQALRQNVEDVDRRWGHFKNVEVAKAVAYGAATGLVAGAVAQWGITAFREHVLHEKGVPQSSIEKLISKITGHHEYADPSTPYEYLAGEHTKLDLPEGFRVLETKDTPGLLTVVDEHGRAVHGPFALEKDGRLPEAVRTDFYKQGWLVTENVERETKTIPGHMVKTTATPEEYAAKSKELVRIARGPVPHLDYDTPKDYEKAELKLWWGGEHGTGVTKDGDIQFDVAKMFQEQPFHGDLKVDPKELVESGQMRLAVTMSRGTQKFAWLFPIGKDWLATIPHDHEAVKLAFSIENGQADFHGGFVEASQMIVDKDGNPIIDENGDLHLRELATLPGEGLKSIEVSKLSDPKIFEEPRYDYDFLKPRDWEVPPTIPLSRRKPLEGMQRGRETPPPGPPYYYGDGEYGLLDRARYRERRSAALRENPKLDLSKNDAAVVHEYLAQQDLAYLRELEDLTAAAPAMRPEVEAVIAVPAYQEGKNLEKTIRRYATLEGQDRFELAILENHPHGVARDESAEVIARMQREFPDLRIVHLYKEFDTKPEIGRVRKYLNDAVLLRKEQAGIEHPVVHVSNDADLEDINERYVVDLLERFKENPKLDAVGAKWDYPDSVFRGMPLLHAAQRAWQYLDMHLRTTHFQNSPELVGRNAAFRSGTYAAVGGYNERAKLAEDLELGWLIREARGNDAERIQYANTPWLVSNPRRAAATIASGKRLVEEYGDFHENEEVRRSSLEQLIARKQELTEGELENQLQGLYEHYGRWQKSNGGWLDDRTFQRAFRRAMEHVGVHYEIANGRVRLGSTEKIRERLARYPERRRREAGGRTKRRQLQRTRGSAGHHAGSRT